MGERVKVFVGCAPHGQDAESLAVLEWSLRKHSSLPVDITWMYQGASPEFTGWDTRHWATPFSGFRWAVPEMCGYHGKAIYMDSDMIVLSDIAGLWYQDTRGHVVLARGGGEWRLCVSLWDCAKAKGKIPPIEAMKADPAAHMAMRKASNQPGFIGSFSGDWNTLDREYTGQADILHYTDMRAQPQHRHAGPRLEAAGVKHWFRGELAPYKYPAINELFDGLLAEAAANGYGVERYTC